MYCPLDIFVPIPRAAPDNEDETLMPADSIDLVVTLSALQAQALAQFLTSANLEDFGRVAVDRVEAALMEQAAEVIRRSLADRGFDPRRADSGHELG